MKKINIGILKETKIPSDNRVCLVPDDIIHLLKKFNINIYIESCTTRCVTDDEYLNAGINVIEDISFCDAFIGVKEVNINSLIDDKIYMFFSHTAKKQIYNKELLKALIDKNIHMIDYEYLTDENNKRIIAFGEWAGIIGTYNAIQAYVMRYTKNDIRYAHQLIDFNDMKSELDKVTIRPGYKIIVTGKGRVGHGAIEILNHMKIKEVTVDEFLYDNFNEPVYCWICANEYTKNNFEEFSYNDMHLYENNFKRFAEKADMYISCHVWKPSYPLILDVDDYDNINIKIIADITCDILGSIKSTIRPSTIRDPFYGYKNGKETYFLDNESITVMAVDNLPNSLPLSASKDFSKILSNKVLPEFIKDISCNLIEKASICKNGKLTNRFAYLQDFIDE